MAVTNQQIFDFLIANPNISDKELAAVMQEFKVTPQQVAEATGTSPTEAIKRFEAVVSPPSVDRIVPTARGTVIEGDNIEEQIAGVPQVVYETRVDPNNKANWETYNPKTGEIIDSGTFAGGGDQGLLRAAAPVIGLAASTVGLPFITELLGSTTGLTGSALSGATGATIGAGTQAVTGGSAEDIARAALLGGGGAYLGSQLNDYIASMDVPVDFNNMTPEQIADATETNFINDAKRAGLTNAQINDFMSNAGGTLATTPVAVSTPVTDGGTVAVTAPTTPSLSNVLSTIASTTPTVNVAAPKAPQQVDQAVLDLVNSQLATNVATPANVQVTAQKPVTNQDIVNSIVASLPIITPTTTPVAQQTITAQKPATVQEVVNAITATLPTVTPTQAATIAEQVVTSNRPVTTQEVVNAITATLPAVVAPTVTTPTVAEQVVTAQKPITTQEVVNAITAALPTVPAVTTPVVPEQVVTAQKPSSITDDVTAATIPLIQPSTPLTPTQVTAEQELSNSEKIRLAQLGLTAAGLLGAGAAASSGSGGTQFPIVPIPESWGNPPKTGVAPFTPLSPINFGDRNLLIGTQWEKFLDPNYGKVPQPVQYSQPSNLSYNDLMGILGSKQGMPPASSLSINDIISGIQNQYGQASRSTMG